MNFFDTIFSANFLGSVLRMATPIIFVTMAACIGVKANVLCVAYESMMLFAALAGALGSAYCHSWVGGGLIGILASIILALIFAYFVLYLDTDPMLTGIALNTFGSSGTVYLMFLLTGSRSTTARLSSVVFPNLNPGFLASIPVLSVLFEQNLLTYLSIFSAIALYVFLFKTALGLRIRSVGEQPLAAVSVGINVKQTKLEAILISGLFAGLGGVFMSMSYMPYFTRDMISGRGFMALAAASLANGHPMVGLVFSLVFGAASAFGNILQTLRLPEQFASMVPYLVTIVGLCFMKRRTKK